MFSILTQSFIQSLFPILTNPIPLVTPTIYQSLIEGEKVLVIVIGGGRITSNVTWTPTFRKQQLGRKGVSQRVQNHNRHRVVRIEPVFWQYKLHYESRCNVIRSPCLQQRDASNKRNLMAVGGHADNFVDLCGEDSADGKRQCLGKGQTVLTKPPSQSEVQECWSEVIVKCGLSPSVVDDPLFRKALVTNARMGQSAVCMGKGTALHTIAIAMV